MKAEFKRAFLAALAIALFAPIGALAVEVNVEFDETVDFAKFKTFSVKEGHLNSRSPALNSELTKKRIQSEIEKALAEKGLTPVKEAADLQVVFRFGSMRNMDTKTVPAGFRGRGSRTIHVPQAEGTMVIDLLDSTSSSLVWRSTAIEGEPNPAKLADKLDNMVKKAVGKFPPKK
jgi:hypothetical protein